MRQRWSIMSWFKQFFTRGEEDPLDKFERLFSQGKYSEALPLIEAIVIVEPTISTSWINLGATLAALDRPLDAAQAYVRGSELDPSRNGLYSACHLLAQAGETTALLELFERECNQDPSMLELFIKADTFKPYFARVEFQALRARYGT